jgi:hypothetical protein
MPCAFATSNAARGDTPASELVREALRRYLKVS